MKLHIKQKPLSFTGRFTVKDDNGQDKYTAQAEVFSWGKKYHVYDQTHEEVIFIQEKIFSLLPKYFITIKGEEVAQIEKKFTFFRPKYELIAQGWSIEGDWTSHNYVINHYDQLIATIRKEWFTWGDSYYVDIVEEKHELMCLAIVIAIDCVMASAHANAAATNQ